MVTLKERYAATLVGSAMGDALGMPVEGWKKAQIAKYTGKVITFLEPVIPLRGGAEIERDEYGPLKKWTRGLALGEYTDDTILTLATVQSMVEQKRVDAQDIMQKMVDEYQQRKNTHSAEDSKDNKIPGAFGKTTIDAFDYFLETGKTGRPPGNRGGPGNGTCMRIAPLGMYGHALGQKKEQQDEENYLMLAREVSELTHFYPASIASGITQAFAISNLLAKPDQSAKEFISALESVCRDFETRYLLDAQSEKLSPKLTWIKDNLNASDDTAITMLGNSSHVLQSYPFAVFMFQKYMNMPWEGLVETVNAGGDCDTTAAMYGALAGAKNGKFWPDELEAKLKDFDALKRLGEDFHAIFTQHTP